MLRRKRHRWIRDAIVAIGVAVLAVGIYKLLGSLGVVLLGGPCMERTHSWSRCRGLPAKFAELLRSA